MQKGYVQEFLNKWETPLKLARMRYRRLYAVLTDLGIEDDDLEQDCWTSLMRAAKGFRPERGTKFATYAGKWIGQAMQKSARNRQRSDVKTQAGGTVSGDAFVGGRHGTPGPLWDLIPARGDGETNRIDRVNDLREKVADALRCLQPRDREVVTLRFGLDGNPPMSGEQVGVKMKITRERVRQILDAAIKRLRLPLGKSCGDLLE